MSTIELMVTHDLPEPLMRGLQNEFVVHHREHIRDPRVLTRIRAIVSHPSLQVGKDLMGLLPDLRIVLVLGTQASAVDTAEAARRRISVHNITVDTSEDRAELAMALLLALVRRIPMAERHLREGDWVDGDYPLCTSVRGLRLGVVGTAHQTQALWQRAQAFGLQLADASALAQAPSPQTLLALAVRSDALVLLDEHLLEQTGGLHANVLQALGPRGLLVHLAHGAHTDEALLAQALQSHWISALAYDVHPQALRVGPALRQARGVLLTPALAERSQAIQEALTQALMGQLRAFFGLPG